MENETYLALAAVACFGFAGLNFVMNEARILPGWILLGVMFTVAAAAKVAFVNPSANELAES